jgi:hypothetical protein
VRSPGVVSFGVIELRVDESPGVVELLVWLMLCAPERSSCSHRCRSCPDIRSQSRSETALGVRAGGDCANAAVVKIAPAANTASAAGRSP